MVLSGLRRRRQKPNTGFSLFKNFADLGGASILDGWLFDEKQFQRLYVRKEELS